MNLLSRLNELLDRRVSECFGLDAELHKRNRYSSQEMEDSVASCNQYKAALVAAERLLCRQIDTIRSLSNRLEH